MDHPDSIVCSFVEKSIRLKRVNVHAQLYREARCLILDLNIYLSTFLCLGVMAAITKFSCHGIFDYLVHSVPACVSKPISLHRDLNFGQIYHKYCQHLQYLVSKMIK